MTSKQRIHAAMEGRATDAVPVSLYVSWPEYGWRFTGRPVWDVVLGEIDGIDAFKRLMERHPSDFAHGPLGALGNGWLRGKTPERETRDHIYFKEDVSSRRWRFDLRSHVLEEIDSADRVIERALHPGDSRLEVPTPSSEIEAEAWFRARHTGASTAPAHAPEEDRAVALWGSQYFMVTCTVGPFVAVAYAFGFERALTLLSEHPRVYARLMELYIDHFEAHFRWAARAGYDGGHMVESWCSADMISPAVYRDWIAPAHRESARMIRTCGLKADLYSPGWFMPMLPFVRGQGWDAIRIDDQCRGEELDIAEARRVLGPDQCLFGNMSAYALLRGDREDITARARRQFEIAGRTGPLIASNGSGICDATDPASIDHWLAVAAEGPCFPIKV